MNSEHSETMKYAGGLAITEGVTGLAAVALSIIGLTNIHPWLLASVATIALGAVFVFEAGSIGARFLSYEQTSPGVTSRPFGSFMTAGFLAGCAGIALGILALLAVVPKVLIPVAIVVYGASLILDSGMRARLSQLEGEHSGWTPASQEMAREAASASSSIQMLAGLGAVTLGILAIIGFASQVLTLVALLSVGAVILLAGSTTGGRIASMFRI